MHRLSHATGAPRQTGYGEHVPPRGSLMAYKLLDMAQARWRRLDGAHLLTLVRAGIAFIDGVQPEGKASKVKARAA